MSNLTPELQKQIEQEAKDRSEGWTDRMKSEIAKSEYYIGATSYALKWQEAEQRAERYEKALKHIQATAKNGIFPHLPVETMGAQVCIEIDQYITDLFTPKQTTDEQP